MKCSICPGVPYKTALVISQGSWCGNRRGWKRLKGQMPCFGFRKRHSDREQPALAKARASAHTLVLEGFLVSLGQTSQSVARRMQQG